METDHSDYARELLNKTQRRINIFYISIESLTILEISRISGGIMML